MSMISEWNCETMWMVHIHSYLRVCAVGRVSYFLCRYKKFYCHSEICMNDEHVFYMIGFR